MAEFGRKVVFRRPGIVKLCCQVVVDRGGLPAVNFDMVADKTNWDNKISFQLTIHECSLVAAYFLGAPVEIFLGYHGSTNNLALQIAPSSNNAKSTIKTNYLALVEKGKPLHYMHLHSYECYSIFDIIVEQLAKNGQSSKSETLHILKQFYSIVDVARI